MNILVVFDLPPLCDHCGEEPEPDEVASVEIVVSPDARKQYFKLCPRCVDTLLMDYLRAGDDH